MECHSQRRVQGVQLNPPPNFMTIVMTCGNIDGRNKYYNAPTLYAYSTHLASYSFVGYNLKKHPQNVECCAS